MLPPLYLKINFWLVMSNSFISTFCFFYLFPTSIPLSPNTAAQPAKAKPYLSSWTLYHYHHVENWACKHQAEDRAVLAELSYCKEHWCLNTKTSVQVAFCFIPCEYFLSVNKQVRMFTMDPRKIGRWRLTSSFPPCTSNLSILLSYRLEQSPGP